ncbi:MAG TPA: mechanosensitive ion channel domain-containing protein [Ignavibacteriaceae bacterium]
MEEIFKSAQGLIVQYGLRIVGAIATLVIGIWLAKFLAKLLGKALKRKDIDPTLGKFFVNILKITLIVFVLISFASQLGIETTSFVAVIGAAGLAIGFALQGSLANFASGVMLIIFRPFKSGDFIEAAGVSGSVEQIGIFTSVFNSPDNKQIIVPNSKLTSDTITNYSANATRRVDLVFGIGYRDDIDKARSVIQAVLDSDTRILKDPAPQILVSELADSSVKFFVRPWVQSDKYWDVYFDVIENIKKKFDQERISIPFPQRDVHVHQN